MWYVNQGMERKTVTHLLPLNRYLCHEVVPNVAHDGSSDHGAVRRGHGSKKEKKGSVGCKMWSQILLCSTLPNSAPILLR
jgi:hypothetical protein